MLAKPPDDEVTLPMALTPDDLLNKEFPETKFRPGYDKDEVDDFLDEVVVEWRRLTQANEELTAQVAALEEQLDQDPHHVEPDDLKDAGLSGYAGTAAEVTGTVERVEDEEPESEPEVPEEPAEQEPELRADPSVTAYPEYELGTRPAQERPAEEPAVEEPAPAAEAAGVLAMAQKLHDQYVSEGEQTRAAYIAEGEQTRAAYISEGEAKRAELISDGETTREQLITEGATMREEHITEGETKRTQIITDAETRAENMIEEAELTSTRTLNALERKKADLETRVTELTGFERDYRARLKEFIESQLSDLNSQGSIEKETAGQ